MFHFSWDRIILTFPEPVHIYLFVIHAFQRENTLISEANIEQKVRISLNSVEQEVGEP